MYTDPASPNSIKGFAYDYFIKDHLGNVRMVLTDERKQDIYPAATLEGSIDTDGSPNALFKEKEYYTIDAGHIVDTMGITGLTTYENKNGGPLATDVPVNPNPNSVVTGCAGAIDHAMPKRIDHQRLFLNSRRTYYISMDRHGQIDPAQIGPKNRRLWSK